MKKTIIIAAAALMVCIGANAQDDSKQKKEQRQRPDEAAMIQERTDRMAEKYGLDEAQKAKLLELNTEYSGKMGPGRKGPSGPGGRGPRMDRPDARRDTARLNKGDRPARPMRERPELTEGQKQEMEARKKEMEAGKTAYEEALKGILTEDQFQAYKKDQERQRPPRRR